MEQKNTTDQSQPLTPQWFDVLEEKTYRWVCALCEVKGQVSYFKYDEMLDAWELHEATAYHLRSIELNGHRYGL